LKAQAELFSWLMFTATGIGPYSGQAVHFKHFAPKGLDYAVTRYLFEARRHWGILDTHRKTGPFILGAEYTIADMAAWGWAPVVPFVLGDSVWDSLSHLKRWFDLINTRPAAARANALKDKYTFKTEMDDEARNHMFRHIAAV
jgi:GST-like protein